MLAFDKHLQGLATLQNKAVKLISGAKRREILKLNDLHLYEDPKLMYKQLSTRVKNCL